MKWRCVRFFAKLLCVYVRGSYIDTHAYKYIYIGIRDQKFNAFRVIPYGADILLLYLLCLTVIVQLTIPHLHAHPYVFAVAICLHKYTNMYLYVCHCTLAPLAVGYHLISASLSCHQFEVLKLLRTHTNTQHEHQYKHQLRRAVLAITHTHTHNKRVVRKFNV